MPLTLDAWLPVLRPHLSPELVDDHALEKIHALMCHFPGDIMGVFEVRLAPGTHPVDFSVRLENLDQARQLASKMPTPHLCSLLEEGWASLGYPDPIESLWLEFDLERGSPEQGLTGSPNSQLPIPVVCARFSNPPEHDWLVSNLFPALHGQPLARTQQQLLVRCLEKIPKDWYLLYAFRLLSRHENAVRLELFGHNMNSIYEYARHVISEDAANRLEQQSALFEGCDRYHFSFDVHEAEISPRIGLECAYSKLPKNEPRWKELFDRLVNHGLCTSEKRDAVFEWPGYETIWTAASRWPGGLAFNTRLVKALSHLKLVIASQYTGAKAYVILEPFLSWHAVRLDPKR